MNNLHTERLAFPGTVFLNVLPTLFSHHFPIYSSGYNITVLRGMHVLIQLDFNMLAFCSHCASPIQAEQWRLFIFPGFDGVYFALHLGNE